MFEEEKEALQAIYYLPGECTVQDKDITLRLAIDANPQTDTKRDVTVIIYVGENYPNAMPEFSVISEDIKREKIANLKAEVTSSCSELIGQPMLVAMVATIQEYLEKNKVSFASVTSEQTNASAKSEGTSNSPSGDDKWTALLHIDHMRSKTKYCKTLEKWTKDLDLKGCLLFCKRLILLLLQGDVHNIKEFIVRLKTVSIDVDSRGHSCKEKMMSVLTEEQCPSAAQCFSNYQVLELSDVDQLEKVFIDSGLQDIYKKYVSHLKG